MPWPLSKASRWHHEPNRRVAAGLRTFKPGMTTATSSIAKVWNISTVIKHQTTEKQNATMVLWFYAVSAWARHICKYSTGSLDLMARLESKIASFKSRACCPKSEQSAHSSTQFPCQGTDPLGSQGRVKAESMAEPFSILAPLQSENIQYFHIFPL